MEDEDSIGLVKEEAVEMSADEAWCCSPADCCDVSQLCRVCAKPSKYMTSIFSAQGMQQQLQDKITNFLPIKVSRNDTLPLQVCVVCAEQLEASQVLAQVCAVADISLRSLFDAWPSMYGDINLLTFVIIATVLFQKSVESPMLVTNTNYSDVEYFSQFEYNSADTLSEVETICSQDLDLKSKYRASLSSDVETIGSQDFELKSTNSTSFNIVSSEVETIGSQDYRRDSSYALSSDVETIGSQDFEVRVPRKRKYKNSQTSDVSQESGVFPCTLCDAMLLNFIRLQEHYWHVHQMKGCSNCEDVFSNIGDFLLHVQSEHPFLVTCRICNESFSTEKLLQLHFSAVHPTSQVFSCDLCAKVFKTSAQLLLHQFEAHMQTFVCKFCDAAFCDKQILCEHVNNLHKNAQKNITQKYVCANCDNEFKSKVALRHHMLGHVENSLSGDDKLWGCANCCKTFVSKVSLEHHVKTHFTFKAANTCPLCDKAFNTSNILNMHFKNHVSGQWNYECGICKCILHSEKCTLLHIQTHSCIDIVESKCTNLFTRSSDFYCKECNKYFYNDKSLLEHLKSSHTSTDMRFQCSLCPKTFNKKYCLNVHARSHMKVKPYACSECDKSFSLSRSLQDHMRSVHLNERPFLCELCGKAFTSYSCVSSHKFYVHKKQKLTKFHCSFCNKLFYKRHLFELHEQTHKQR